MGQMRFDYMTVEILCDLCDVWNKTEGVISAVRLPNREISDRHVTYTNFGRQS